MKTTSKFGVAILAALALSSAANAAYISGEIGFFGTYQNNPGPPQTLSFAGFGGAGSPFVGASNGSYAGLVGQQVGDDLGEYFGPLQINPLVAPQNLWSVTLGTTTYSFVITSISALQDGWMGSGVASIDDGLGTYEPTGGTWALTKQQGMTFSAGVASVPDGGTTVALLGASLLGLFGMRRKLAVK